MTNGIGLLVISNIKQITQTLKTIEKYFMQVLYIHLNIDVVENSVLPSRITSPPIWCRIISQLYIESEKSFAASNSKAPSLNILISPLKQTEKARFAGLKLKSIDVLYSDSKQDMGVCDELRECLGITKPTVYLANDTDTSNTLGLECEQTNMNEKDSKVYQDVVLGGTFDRIHCGHKIFLTQAVLKARRRLVVGITSKQMLGSKIMHELILPIDKRIADIKRFLEEIDSTLIYEIIQIDDPIGPTGTDPHLEMIVVSAETRKGALSINNERLKNNLPPLDIHCIELIDNVGDNIYGIRTKDNKISSSNTRLELLGTRLRQPERCTNLPPRPYIIGLTGGIGSGKSNISEYFSSLGAMVIDCDKIAHEVYQPGEICYERIIEHFGTSILNEDKSINRQQLGRIVFQDSKELETLNSIVWPPLLVEVKRRIRNDCAKHEVVILEAAVLLQAKWHKEVHEVWSMIIPVDEAIKRIMKRNNITEGEARQRVSRQVSNENLVAHSHIVFSSQWDKLFTQKQARKAWSLLMNELKEK